MKKLTNLFFALLLFVGCSKENQEITDKGGQKLKAAPSGAAVVNLSNVKQVIRGFGGSSAWHGYLTDGDCDKLFTTLGLSILRVRIDPDGLWDEEIANAQKAKARGAIVFASPWSAPAYMKSNNSTVGGYLLPEHYSNYVNWLNSFISAMSQVPLYAISVQNEPNINVNYESCSWTSEQMTNFIANNAGAFNSGTKVIMPETFNYATFYADPILNNATAAANTDICAYHWYGANRFQSWANAVNKGKDIWMTEHYSNDQTIGGALATAVDIHKFLTINYINAYIWWWVKNESCNIITETGINKRGYVLGQFAKFVRPGFSRVDVTGGTNISAFTGNGRVVIVAINTGTGAKNQQFTIQGETVTSVTPTVTSETVNMQTGSPINVINGSFTASLPAKSITTFVQN